MTSLEMIVDGIALGESPRWHDDRIWFCDWVDGDVRSADAGGGVIITHAHVDGVPVCIDWDGEGRLLVVNGSTKELLRSTTDGLEHVADLSPLSDYPWNEVVGHPSGAIYVNGIGYDMMAGEAPATGQIALVEPSGEVRNRHCRRVTSTGHVVETVEADRGCFSCATAPNGDLYITATV